MKRQEKRGSKYKKNVEEKIAEKEKNEIDGGPGWAVIAAASGFVIDSSSAFHSAMFMSVFQRYILDK